MLTTAGVVNAVAAAVVLGDECRVVVDALGELRSALGAYFIETTSISSSLSIACVGCGLVSDGRNNGRLLFLC